MLYSFQSWPTSFKIGQRTITTRNSLEIVLIIPWIEHVENKPNKAIQASSSQNGSVEFGKVVDKL